MDYSQLLNCLRNSGFEPDDEIDISKTFSDNGLDSLDVFSWISEIEAETGVSIDDEELQDLFTPAQLLDIIISKQK